MFSRMSIGFPLVAACSIGLLPGCRAAGSGSEPAVSGQEDRVRLSDQSKANLDELMAELVGGRYRETDWFSMSAFLRIDHLRDGILYERAAGVARADSDKAATVDRQFLISSASKMMLAVVVLQLWEEGRFGESGLDVTLAELGVFSREVLDAISVLDGESHGPGITIRQLLAHTSGLGGNWRGLGFWEEGREAIVAALSRHAECLEDPSCDPEGLPTVKQWRPWVRDDPFAAGVGLLNSYLRAERESSSALAKPGDEYHYRDLNYWILGVVVEELSGRPLHAVLRERIYDPLTMRDTYQSYTATLLEEARARGLSDFYIGPMPIVSSGVNFSIDWAGGGIATTLRDFAAFHLALIRGDLFEREATYQEMRRSHWGPIDGDGHVEHAGLGYFLSEIGDSRYYGHTGFLGAFSLHDEERGLLLTGTLNKAADSSFFRIIDDIGRAVALK